MSRRLDTVQRIRRIQERVARAEVARRRVELAERERARSQLVALVDDRARHDGTSIALVAAHAEMIGGGIANVAVATGAVVDAAAEVDGSMATWTAAAQRQEGIDRLAERLDEQRRRDEERRTRIELDEIVVARWETP